MIVRLRLYCTRRDPVWEIHDPKIRERVRQWGRAAEQAPRSNTRLPLTGYRGFDVVDDDGHRYRIYGNQVVTTDQRIAFGGPAMEAELMKSNQEALVRDHRLDASRFVQMPPVPIAGVPPVDWSAVTGLSSPLYEPWRWNESGLVRDANTCYAYANNVITENNVLPFRGDSDMTVDAIENALVHDDLARLGQRVSGVDEAGAHVIAAVVQLLDEDSGDFHFFRLDRGGTWSHKPGGDDATNCDDNGQMIKDIAAARFRTPFTFVGFYLSTPAARAVLGERGALFARR